MLYFHYQERAFIGAFHKILTDTVMSQEELEKTFDELQIESLLNSMGKWDDNGVVYMNQDGEVAKAPWEPECVEFPLQNRIAAVVAFGNLDDYRCNKGLDNWNGCHPVGET